MTSRSHIRQRLYFLHKIFYRFYLLLALWIQYNVIWQLIQKKNRRLLFLAYDFFSSLSNLAASKASISSSLGSENFFKEATQYFEATMLMTNVPWSFKLNIHQCSISLCTGVWNLWISRSLRCTITKFKIYLGTLKSFKFFNFLSPLHPLFANIRMQHPKRVFFCQIAWNKTWNWCWRVSQNPKGQISSQQLLLYHLVFFFLLEEV